MAAAAARAAPAARAAARGGRRAPSSVRRRARAQAYAAPAADDAYEVDVPEDAVRQTMALVWDRPELHEPMLLLADPPSRALLAAALDAPAVGRRYSAVSAALRLASPSAVGDAALAEMSSDAGDAVDARTGALLGAVGASLGDADVVEAFVAERAARQLQQQQTGTESTHTAAAPAPAPAPASLDDIAAQFRAAATMAEEQAAGDDEADSSPDAG